jgi:hypothetical protein
MSSRSRFESSRQRLLDLLSATGGSSRPADPAVELAGELAHGGVAALLDVGEDALDGATG